MKETDQKEVTGRGRGQWADRWKEMRQLQDGYSIIKKHHQHSFRCSVRKLCIPLERMKIEERKIDRKERLAMKTARNTDFFRQFNGAFFQGNRQFIEDSIAEDIVWTMVGSEPIRGKQAFLDVAFGVEDGYADMEYTVELSLTNGREAALKGRMIRKSAGEAPKIYAYCDFYVLDEDDGKIKEMTTFVIELKE